jgi:hypothetical protein
MEDPLSLEVHALPGKLTRPSNVLEIPDEEEIRGLCSEESRRQGVINAVS